MTSQEAYQNLLLGGDPGHILFRPILMHFAARYSGKSYAEFASDYRILVDCNIRAMEAFETDMVGLISDPYRETAAFGARISFPEEMVPRCEGPIVTKLDDVKSLENPDVYKAARTLDRILGARLFQKELRGTVPVIGWIEGPLAEACDLAGVDQMLTRMMTDRAFCEYLMDKCTRTAKDFAGAQIEAGCGIIGMGDAICSQIDADSYADLVLDRQKEIIDFIHSQGAQIKLHICGDIRHLLPHIAKLGVDILDVDHMVTMEKARKELGKKVILSGNLDPVMIMEASSAKVEEACGHLMESQAGERFILSAGCEIGVDTPHENLLAMRKASK